jgi:hypothetical protein
MTKYRNQKTNGYDSGREAKRAQELILLEKAGKITNLRFQVRYEIIPKCPPERAAHYIADFVYEKDGQEIVEDSKGFRTSEYKLKRKLMNYVHGIKILET